ncbi:hypothetical protein [Massilia sp. Leaf139]|uniref:hypothetical protein n=1 Tax=Massilia sp. Leaf139 TaxID=1736272 RepID=UPI0006F37CB3|nr:hypothetical protein [Massilia sp. Leaf139]KQQ92037.1 hypothetical protein ASF77_08950 [Massilia sp. Leaf139]
MQTRPFLALTLAAALFLAGCNPTYNWRDYSSPDAPYRIMFPAKPATHTRSVDLNGMQVQMTMTAAEVEGVMFAVGTGVAPDAAGARAAVDAMKTALVRNIGAEVERESTAAAGANAAVDIDALGTARGQPMKLRGHFEARGTRFYQVIVMGKANEVKAEHSDQFISSFSLL